MSTLSIPTTKQLLADHDITAAIERLYSRRQGVSATWIDVSTTEGIVTLKGFTDSLLSLDRAEEIAKLVRGVRGVVNELEIRTPEVPDAKLLADLKEALATNPATQSLAIECLAKTGEVELRGTVRSYAERQQVLRVVKGVRGIRRVDDHLTYVPALTPRPDDEMAASIRELLRWNVRVHAGLVSVSVKNGAVKLSGVVGSALERSEVIGIAWSAGAAKAVDSKDLRVEPWVPSDDVRQDKYAYHSETDIAQAVRDAFVYDPRVFSFEPTVTVQGSTVTLTGTVNSLAAKRAAEQDARNVVGVSWVNNRLKVRPAGPFDDVKLRNHVQAALTRDPYVGRYPITVLAYNSTVNLSGSVPTHFEAAHAEQVAAGISGVVQVDNHLHITANAPAWFGRSQDGTLTHAVNLDQAIEQAIRQELYWNAFLHDLNLQVSVKNGQATLRGNIENWHQAQLAIHCALAGGASSVNNKLRTTSEAVFNGY
ncbi:BON domain-containing protein [Hymenobacter armeniacus]|uniref:BON domain-containing protein n=1 Tax=Hymenobacter armeniacus TaxID=2771358 RepID=A0ABR8JM26_9BACT|nr:BON domain-containing protein [Hymenobacter armeniacus]MBD2721056.1 BON domain-containing protein [Hymenobacter armeniacus]